MMPGAKCHFRVNDYIIFSHRDIRVERTVDSNFTFYQNRLEIILFPFLIPVSTGDKFYRITYLRLNGNICHCFPQNLFCKLFCRNICRHLTARLCLRCNKTFVSRIRQIGCKQIGHIFRRRLYGEFH